MSRDLIEVLRQWADDPMWADHAEVPKIVLRKAADRIAALEASASEGERRGLRPTDAMVSCFNDPSLNPEWVRGRLSDALALIPEAPAREGWQPIETAPRVDPLRSILIATRGYVGGVVQVSWSDTHQDFVDQDEDTYPDATHWRPLPPPPSQDQREG